MRWFSHRRSPSPRAATQWYRLLLFAAWGLATVHALLCISLGTTQQFFVFCPCDLDLWPSNSGEIFVQCMYLTAKFDCPTFSRSEVIVRTNKHTTDKQTNNKQTPLKTSTSLRYTLRRWVTKSNKQVRQLLPSIATSNLYHGFVNNSIFCQ